MKILFGILIFAGLGIIVGAGIVVYDLYAESQRSVHTNDGRVVADLVQVGSISPGRIIVMNVDVGISVMVGQVIATVDIPAVISRSDITDTTKIGFLDVQDQRVDVLAPRSGVIAARWAKEGDTVSAGESIVTIMDPRQVWVEANIREEDIDLVQRGQLVEVEVASRDDKLVGRVETVWPVTAATLRPTTVQSSSGNLRQRRQVVPVKIILDEGHPSLIPGSSAEVTIQVR